MVIAIDGPGGVGKSSVTRGVAAELGLPYLDTGATYRAATLAVLRAGVAPEAEGEVFDVVRTATIDYVDGVVTLDGEAVGAAVRTPEVTGAVSAVSAFPQVREHIVALQRTWVARRSGRAVVEGRDIGTTVFPGAAVKVFLTARPEVRAERRAGDSEAAGATVGEIAEDLEQRDRRDSTRETSPLRPAEDAVVLDTSDLDLQGVIDAVLALVESAERGELHEHGGF